MLPDENVMERAENLTEVYRFRAIKVISHSGDLTIKNILNGKNSFIWSAIYKLYFMENLP